MAAAVVRQWQLRVESGHSAKSVPAYCLLSYGGVPRPARGSQMFFAKVDHWVGRTLFLPLIIKFCQLTRQSQFACSRLFWFISALDGFYRAQSMVSSIIWGGMSVLMMVSATRRANAPTNSSMVFRMLGLAFLFYDVIKTLMSGVWAGSEFWLLVLIAEYAVTIGTLPPQASEQSRASGRISKVGRKQT